MSSQSRGLDSWGTGGILPGVGKSVKGSTIAILRNSVSSFGSTGNQFLIKPNRLDTVSLAHQEPTQTAPI